MGYFLALSKAATIAWLDVSEWLLLSFGVILVIGIVGEIRLPEWHHRLKAFEILVLVGVLGELVADGGMFFFSSHLQTISEAEKSQDAVIANLDAETALARLAAAVADARAKGLEAQITDSSARVKTAEAQIASANAASREAVAKGVEASAKAEGFRLDIARANENASKAEERVADAKLELAKLKEPRTLTQRHIRPKLELFARQEFALSAYPNPEALALAALIDAFLRSCQWDRIPPQISSINVDVGSVPAGQSYDSGVAAFIAPDDKESRDALSTLGNELASAGLACEIHLTSQLTGKSPRAITIEILAKP